VEAVVLPTSVEPCEPLESVEPLESIEPLESVVSSELGRVEAPPLPFVAWFVGIDSAVDVTASPVSPPSSWELLHPARPAVAKHAAIAPRERGNITGAPTMVCTCPIWVTPIKRSAGRDKYLWMSSGYAAVIVAGRE
jgi:hypothetical protein